MVLINVVLIGFMVARPKMPPRGKPVDLKNIISEKLNLDEEQQRNLFRIGKEPWWTDGWDWTEAETFDSRLFQFIWSLKFKIQKCKIRSLSKSIN